MSDVKLTTQDFDLNFKDAPDFENLPEGQDPTDELYDFAGNAGMQTGTSQQASDFAFYNYVKQDESTRYPDGYSKTKRPCLGGFTHSTYKIDRFGAVFQADWALYRIQGETKAILKDYGSDEGLSIAPEDLGKVFKGTEFTQAMNGFHQAYKQKMGELKQTLKEPDNLDELTPQRLGELADAVSNNDLGKVFQILYKPEFVEKNLATIKQAVRLHLYLEAGLTLSQNNKDYKVTQSHAIKSAIAGTKNPFFGVSKNSGQKQADQVLNKLTEDKVMNELIPLLLNGALYDNMLNEEEPAIEPESSESDAVGTTDTTGTETLTPDAAEPATTETVPQPQTSASETTADDLAVPTTSPAPITPTPEPAATSIAPPTVEPAAAPVATPVVEPAAAAPVTTPVVEPAAAPVELPVVQPAPVELPPAPIISTEPETVSTSDIIEACTTATPSLDDINVLLKEFTAANRPVNQNGDNPVKEVHTKTGTNRILDQENKPLKIDSTTYKNTAESIAELRGYLRALLTLKQPEVIVLRDTKLSTKSVIRQAYTLVAQKTDSGFIDFPKSKTQISDALEQNQKLMAAIEGLKAIRNPDDVVSITITGYASAHSESVMDNGKKVLVTDVNITKYVDPETHTLKTGYTWATGTVPTDVKLAGNKVIANTRFARERAETLKTFLLTQGVSQAIVDKVQTESKGGAFKPTATLVYSVQSEVNVDFSMDADDLTGISEIEKQKVATFMSDVLDPYFKTMVNEKQEGYENEAELASKAETALQAAAKVILALLNPTTFEKATRDQVATKLHTEMQNNASSVYGAKLLARVLETQPEFAHLQFAKAAKERSAKLEQRATEAGILNTVRTSALSSPTGSAPVAAKIQSGKIIPSAKIEFESGKDVIQESSKTALLDLARFLNQNPAIKITINGHTDNSGDANKNMSLSSDRSTQIMRFLINEGQVDQNRLTATGYGATQPIDTNKTSSGRASNRRVEFVIVTPQSGAQASLPAEVQTGLAEIESVVSNIANTELPAAPAENIAAQSAQPPVAAAMEPAPTLPRVGQTKASFKVAETEPVFELTGYVGNIKEVSTGFGKKTVNLDFSVTHDKLTIVGLVKYSKAVIRLFLAQDVALDYDAAKAKAKMAYPIVVTLKDGTQIKLVAQGE